MRSVNKTRLSFSLLGGVSQRSVGAMLVAMLLAPPSAASAQDGAESAPAAPAATSEPKPAEATETPEASTTPAASPEEQAALKSYLDAFSRYKQETEDYQTTVDAIVQAKYRQKVAAVQSNYNTKIDELTEIERARRIEAIAAFERFVKRHPRNERYTPDALFRLAELYFEKANDDYLAADEKFQEDLTLFEAGKIPDMPLEPERDYAPTTRTFRKLINDWPEYRLLDGAYYLLAYCELQDGNDEEAKDLFMTLIDKRPESQFIPEAWIRVGEYYFDLGELDNARSAYAKSMEFPESRFFDKALYKLAWTHYRQDDFTAAIGRFRELVEFSDKQEAETGRSGSVLRSEAVQYIAISLAESDWDSDGITDDEFGITRTRQFIKADKPYEREVLTQLVEYLFENNFYDESIDVAKFALESYPYNAENPQLHEQLVLAMFRNDQMTPAFDERRKMGGLYGFDSEWYAVQERDGNADAMLYASSLVRDNLIQSATWFHEQAQKERDDALARADDTMLAASKRKYELASKTYAEFLRKHPNDKDAFQWNFYYAETLFYSDQFLEAYEQYRVVREMDLRSSDFGEIQETSAFNAVKALELVLEKKIAAGEIDARVLPRKGGEAEESEAVEGAIVAENIPDLARKYITALDRYVVLGLKNAQDPFLDSKFAFQAAKMFYDFNDFPEARRRFEWIIKNYPELEVGAFAASLTLETYRLEKDYDTLASKANEFATLLKGDQVDTIKAEIAEFELASLFKAAEKAYAAGDYDEAAKKYLELMSRDKERKYTTLALINTAVSYEKLDRPGEAARLYERLYSEFPDDDFAPYGLYRVAVTSERFFEFEKAARNYLAFYDRFADKRTPEKLSAGLAFEFNEKGGQALLNGAILLENLQDYDAAAKRYVEYSTKYSDKDDADDAYWQAIGCWKKGKKNREMLKGYERYIDRYGTSANSENVFKALGALYDHHASKGKEKDAKKWYKRTLDEYARLGIQPSSNEAFYAAKAEFQLVEYEFEDWDDIKLRGKVKTQSKQLQTKIEGQKALAAKYEKVYTYRNLEWTLATGYRVGNMYQRFAQMLYDAPVPFPEDSEQWDIYRTQLDDIAVPLEDKAVENYVKVIDKARQDKIVNAWTKKTLEELNKYRPAEYPLYKEERSAVEERSATGLPFLDAKSYEKMKNPPKPEKKEGGDA